MSVALQLAAIVSMVAITYVAYQAFGPRRATLLYDRTEKVAWDQIIQKQLGSWLTITNIIGTMTSLATVYLFFIGSSKLFGVYTFMCPFTLWLGALATNAITYRVLRNRPRLEKMLKDSSQTGAVIAAIFWDEDPEAQKTAGTAKWLSCANLVGVVWLDFAFFADITGQLLPIGLGDLAWKTIILSFASFTVFYFTFKYGLRGFVFADLFQSPVIILGSIGLFGGVLYLYSQSQVAVTAALTPILPPSQCFLFALHVLCLNVLLVVVTEPHWLRLWVFGDKELRLQHRSILFTAALWTILIAVGLAAGAATNQVGEAATAKAIEALGAYTPILPMFFWVAAIAALFASADIAIYSLLVVSVFDVKRGQLVDRSMASIHPFGVSCMATLILCFVYASVRGLALPFEKLVFAIIPFSLNIFPAFMILLRGAAPDAKWTWASVLGYIILSLIGLFIMPDQNLLFTLGAALVPVIVGCVAYFWLTPRPDSELGD